MVLHERKLIAHLLRRAGFGFSQEELDTAVRSGYEATINDLLDPSSYARPEEDLIDRFNSQFCDEESTRWYAAKWMFRMLNTARPLEEKMALMWHGVFATGYSKVSNAPMMKQQNEMFLDFGLNDFPTLLKKLSRDPAMIYWLDQQTNHKEEVNENYGRELLELFSMGRGNYSEEDVRSCARAFTGWTMTQVLPRYPTGYWASKFVYKPEDHDDGEKTFLGETGRLNGDDVVDIIVKQPATGRFLAHEIYKFFISDDVDENAIDQIANAYFTYKYDLREIMRFVFNSNFFKNSLFKRVKSPVEFIVGTLRLTGSYRDPHSFALVEGDNVDGLPGFSTLMGQELLNPPTVEGWHTGREWIDSAFLVERVNFAAKELSKPDAPGIQEMVRRISTGRSNIARDDLIDFCTSELVQIDLDSDTREVITQELSIPEEVQCDGGDLDGLMDAVTEILPLIGASKEYQMA